MASATNCRDWPQISEFSPLSSGDLILFELVVQSTRLKAQEPRGLGLDVVRLAEGLLDHARPDAGTVWRGIVHLWSCDTAEALSLEDLKDAQRVVKGGDMSQMTSMMAEMQAMQPKGLSL